MKAAVEADPRVELVGVVAALAGAQPARGPLTDFARSFAAHRGHPAVGELAELRAARGDDDALGLVAQLLSPDARLSWKRPRALLSTDFIAACGGDAALDELLDALRAFAKDAAFFRRWKEEGAKAVAAELARAKKDWKTGAGDVEALESYLGERLDARLRFVLCSLYSPRRYTAYILPYPYPRPSQDAPPPGPYEVITLLRPGAGWGTGLDRPLERGLLQELTYVWAELFVWKHRAAVLGARTDAWWQHEATRAVCEAIALRAGAAAGKTTAFPRPSPARDAVLAALAEYEKKRGRKTLAAFGPRLADALRPLAPGAGAR